MFLAKRTCKNDAACVHHKLRTRPAQAILVAYAHAPCAGHSLHHARTKDQTVQRPCSWPNVHVKNDAACVHHKLCTRPAQANLVAYAHAPCAGHLLHHARTKDQTAAKTMFLAKRTCKKRCSMCPSQAVYAASTSKPSGLCSCTLCWALIAPPLKVFGGQRIQGAVGMATRMQVARIMV